MRYEHNKIVICIKKGNSIKGLKEFKNIENLICKLLKMNHKLYAKQNFSTYK